MKILEVKSLKIPEIKVIRFGRFRDIRGFFTEKFRRSDFDTLEELAFLRDVNFVQCNESYSRGGTIRGLHFQWSPYIGKLIRCVYGHMVDMVLDIRKNSPTLGKILLYDMPNDFRNDYSEWIWVPPGFAHGNFFPENTLIEYFCTGQYNPKTEAGISPVANDIDWSLCDPNLRERFDQLLRGEIYLSDKDKKGYTMRSWLENENSANFSI